MTNILYQALREPDHAALPALPRLQAALLRAGGRLTRFAVNTTTHT